MLPEKNGKVEVREPGITETETIMTRIKGLLYKQWILRKKNILTTALTWLFFFILAVSVCISLHHGNLAGNQSFTPQDAVGLAYAVAALIMLSLFDGGRTIFSDAKCHWDKFECALPVSVWQKAAARTAMLAGSSIFVLSLSLLCAWIICTAARQPFDLRICKNLVLLMLTFLLLAVCATGIILKYKSPQAAGARLFGISAAIYLLTAVGSFTWLARLRERFAAMTEEELSDYILREITGRYACVRDMLFPFCPLIFAVILGLGYILFAALLNKKEA